jgi:hypothetical protein
MMSNIRPRGFRSLLDIRRELDLLRRLCSVLYQVCGAHGASVAVLDALSQASAGGYSGNPEGLLPYTPDEACYDSGAGERDNVSHLSRIERKTTKTEYRVWIDEGEGYIVVKPWDDDNDVYEICTEDTEQSQGYFGKISVLLNNADAAKALVEVLLDVAEVLAATEQPNNA